MKQFAKLNVEDRELSQIQNQLADAINPLLKLPLSDCNLIRGVSLITGNNIVNHGLQRPLIGWFVTRKDADESVYDRQDLNATPALTLLLTSSGDVEVDIMVF